MRVVIASVICALAWTSMPSTIAGAPAPTQDPSQEKAAKGPRVEEIAIPIYARSRNLADPRAPFWETLGDGEVFREIHALAQSGVVAGPGQPVPKLKILREFFAPTPPAWNAADGLVGHYVFIVECVRSDLKHVVAPAAR
jgi:hypothetical protein